ncbi:MAG: nucleoside-diphosphate kinase [Phycisphaerae bacterium]|nr:nucleoside-diphosphate kinase [Phycisphaerae bacterium]
MERTLIILKPDAVQRQLVGQIIARFEAKGLQIAAMKLMRISRDLAERHYAVHKGKDFYPRLIEYITASPVVVMVLQGPKAIEVSRKLMGKTFGSQAEPGTIRGDFALCDTFNLVHGSDAPDTAATEIALYFTQDEILESDRQITRWVS